MAGQGPLHLSSDRPGPNPRWASLQAGIAGDVVLPGLPTYDRVNTPFNARFDGVRPQAIVRCATPEDVAETLSFLARHGLASAARSGGHCFAGRSSTRGVVIDVTPMDSVSVSGGMATVGAGARLGAVYDALQQHGLAIPAGTCPPVGIAGLALGGGLGVLGRAYGVTSDHLARAQVVLGDGRIIECDVNEPRCRRGQLRRGDVSRLPDRPRPGGDEHPRYVAVLAGRRVIAGWQDWAPHAPDEVAASLKVTAGGDIGDPPSVDVYAALLGSGWDAAALLDQLVARAGRDPIAVSHTPMSFPQTRRFWAQLGVAEDSPGPGTPPEGTERHHLFAKSEFFGRPLPADAIAALVESFSQGGVPGVSRELDFMPWGGAYNRVPPDATAFVHRAELFQLKHAAVVDPPVTRAAGAAAHRWVGRS